PISPNQEFTVVKKSNRWRWIRAGSWNSRGFRVSTGTQLLDSPIPSSPAKLRRKISPPSSQLNSRYSFVQMNHGQQSGEAKHEDDAALTEFLASLMDYTPTIPDDLVEHYLAKSGFQCPDVRLIRLVAVATQKFVADVASDALQHCRARPAPVVKDKKQQKDKRLVLTMEDLSKALREYGVNVKHPEYFADSPSTGMDPATRDE
uniref:Transcription initiation factor TFIID subunit 10 n=5 Tax=Brassica TaxID=3705 RepID=A0A0D3A2S9_BRAOL